METSFSFFKTLGSLVIPPGPAGIILGIYEQKKNEKGYYIDLNEDYKIDKSSKVYKITRKSDKKVFAMKLFEKLKEDEQQIKEIEVARMIDNPFITKVIEVIPLEDKKGMVMELAKKGSL